VIEVLMANPTADQVIDSLELPFVAVEPEACTKPQESDRTWCGLVEPGDEGTILLLVGQEEGRLLLASPRTRWEGHLPVLTPQKIIRPETIETAIAGARRLIRNRRRTFRDCVFCNGRFPPEHGERHVDELDGFVCHGCMERKLGVVF
jgi:hypothetical protein